MESDVITVSEVAQRLDMDTKAVYRALSRGEIPGALRVGRAFRISRRVFFAWLGVEDGGNSEGVD